jgi:hypothetical protein
MKPRTIGARLLIVAAATGLTITMAGSAAAKHGGEGGHGGGWGWHGGEDWRGGGGWHGGVGWHDNGRHLGCAASSRPTSRRRSARRFARVWSGLGWTPIRTAPCCCGNPRACARVARRGLPVLVGAYVALTSTCPFRQCELPHTARAIPELSNRTWADGPSGERCQRLYVRRCCTIPKPLTPIGCSIDDTHRRGTCGSRACASGCS